MLQGTCFGKATLWGFFSSSNRDCVYWENLPLKVNLLLQGTSFPRCFCWNNINFEYENTSRILCPAGTFSSLHERRVWILRSLRQNYGRYMQKVNQRFSFEFTTWGKVCNSGKKQHQVFVWMVCWLPKSVKVVFIFNFIFNCLQNPNWFFFIGNQS